MTATIVDVLASFIRTTDNDNTMSPHDLGVAVADTFPPFFINKYGNDLIAFVERTNPDKKMGAGRLAELIVAEFGLNEEER